MATPPEPTTSRVVVEADALERLLGQVRPLAAAALLRIALSATPDERGVLVATVSSRTLARQFGVDKDTGAGVLKHLVRRGHLRRLAQPRSGGRFAPARYVVRLPEGIVVTPADGAATPRPCPPPADTTPARPRQRQSAQASPPPRHGAPRRRAAGGPGAQLGLFTPGPTTTSERSAR